MNTEYDDIYDEIYNVILLLFNITKAKLNKASIYELYYYFNQIQLYINETINNKFIEISKASGNEVVEKEKSIFDDYDKENGYEGEEEQKSIYEIYKETLNCTIKYAINNLKMSYKECINCNLSEMLDYIVFNIKYDLEHKDDD
ncbi:hypothetical protein NE172_05305 [Clostridium botulinum]|uniref:Uncharacterized protein n=1 Tax=Clostridium botulinum TaxID=1491 RepID=A0A6B4MZE6_CLOBO|nr:hypothetical protein [Clostridium botulinum]EES48831.1 conserved hypothetical protein [Clostridium botulinum E1 str. 'BoNT E Beluga']MBY6760579.1 hypothetical protein [Clostridium botulinum]MBY6919486.1 hypothetical protein [Clostridium botulinum]MCR1130364.1 hypothetical protein [Clostridium botulinum]NFJ56881.1 hypothetical protein [Clostridium botulinum]